MLSKKEYETTLITLRDTGERAILLRAAADRIGIIRDFEGWRQRTIIYALKYLIDNYVKPN